MCERVQRHGLFMTLNGAKRFSACSSMELTLKQSGTTVSDSKSVGGLSFKDVSKSPPDSKRDLDLRRRFAGTRFQQCLE